MPEIADIADAIATGLNGAGFTEDIEVQRSYRADYKPEDLDSGSTVLVAVVPSGHVGQRLTRQYWQYDHEIQIALTRRVESYGEAGEVAEIDELVGLVEQVQDWLATASLELAGSRVIDMGEGSVLFDSDNLATDGTFMAVITVTCRTRR